MCYMEGCMADAADIQGKTLNSPLCVHTAEVNVCV